MSSSETDLPHGRILRPVSHDRRELHECSDCPGTQPRQPRRRERPRPAGGQRLPFLGERPLECLRALSYPGVHKVIRHNPDGGDVHVLGDPATGSWARAQRTHATEAMIVHSGPRDLRQEYTQLAEFWDHHGRPEPTRFGLTVRHDRTHVLYLDRTDHHVAVLT